MAPGVPPSNAFADLLEREHDRIIERWTERVVRTEARAQAVSTPALLDSVPDFLRHVIASLRRQAPKAIGEHAPDAAGAAREHGRQRYRIGFDLRVVVIEYNLLRELLIEMLEESGLPHPIADIRVITTAFAIGIAEAVDQYSIERENDVRSNLAERERASEFERQLIAIVSHDLRSPLAAIQMSAEVAARIAPADEHMARVLTRIRVGAQRATRLITDLLDFTQERRSGRIPVKPRPASMRELVREAIEETECTCPDRVIHHHEDGPLDGRWDPDRITQVLSNLLTNAVKFSPPASEVTLRAHGTEDGVVLEIHNWGPPIPAPRMATLFEPFQLGDSSGPARPSLGLGLYISRQIVLAHGGSIDVRSSEADGTTFVVRLPRITAEARP